MALVADRLAALYPEELSLRRLLGQAQVDVARIPFDGRASNAAWFASVEAVRQGRLSALVGVMGEEYPLDEWVALLVTGVGGEVKGDEAEGSGTGGTGRVT